MSGLRVREGRQRNPGRRRRALASRVSDADRDPVASLWGRAGAGGGAGRAGLRAVAAGLPQLRRGGRGPVPRAAPLPARLPGGRPGPHPRPLPLRIAMLLTEIPMERDAP
jgi:hypothetical protein